MDPKVKAKIGSIVHDIDAITRELEDIARGLQAEFKGIGSGKSAASLERAAAKYKTVSNELKKI